jgi:hypothetical protein
MNAGPQTLDAVLAEAKRNVEQLDKLYDVPVLLVVSDEVDWEGATAVTAPGAKAPLAGRPPSSPGRAAPATYVVPIQPRNPKVKMPRLAFGRSSICDVVLPFSAVSKHHGYFEHTPTGWVAIDVGSTNGTVVDGKVASQTHPLPMHDGAMLQLGKVSARFLTAAGFVAVLKQRLSV